MNILFMTMGGFDSIEAHSIYADLLRCFRNHGHEIYAITPNERRFGESTKLVHEKGAHVLHVETGDVTGASNLIKKGIDQLLIESTYIKAIKTYFNNVRFDLVLYSTPPITFSRAVAFVKKRDGASSYLLLKDIFPQNAIDLRMMKKNGVKGLIYRFFRRKEKFLYKISDYIGCMSQANVDYLKLHNPEIPTRKIEICPNSVEVIDNSVSRIERDIVRAKYGIPLDKIVFVYGGNLGKPQGIPFLIDCLKVHKSSEAFFLIVGGGSEYDRIKRFIDEEKPNNVKLLASLPKEDYDSMVGACDVGMIFLSYCFTIPNFPSRLLAYMQAKLPVLAVTDPNTDIGKVIVSGEFGWWCESNNTYLFDRMIKHICKEDISAKKEKSFNYLVENYSVDDSYCTIYKHYHE